MRTGHFKETTGQVIALTDNPTVKAWVLLLIAALLLAPQVLGNYQITLMVTVMIAVVGAVGLNVLTGTTGLISLGQSGFLAVGAYGNGILMVDYGWPVWLSLPAGGVVAALISLLVGIPSLRLKGLYLAITTLAFAFIVSHVILYAEPITHGPNGLFVTGASFFGINLQRGAPLYYTVLLVLVLVVLMVLNLQRTRFGRAWLAIREQDIAARAMGIDLTRYKLLAFVISSFIVGIAGGLLSLQLRFINIDVFGLVLSIEAVAILILGGLGSLSGAILGAVFLTLLPEAIRIALNLILEPGSSFYSTYVYEVRGITYGVVIVAFLRFQPEGLIGLWRDTKKYWSNWPLAF